MRTKSVILAFDTTAAHCAAALLFATHTPGETTTDNVITRVDVMAKGQAEHLMGMLQDMLVEASVTWRDLTCIGVGIGPGNFTGIRIAVSAARGLALGLGIPAVGVSGFAAAGLHHKFPFWSVIDAPREMVYVQRMAAGTKAVPRLIAAAGTGGLDAPVVRLSAITAPEMISNLAEITLLQSFSPQPRPAPLYVRPPDAAPSRDAAPLLLP